MINYDRIKKDCFWDLEISNDAIDAIIRGEDMRKNLAEVYFFDKPLLIDELKWIA